MKVSLNWLSDFIDVTPIRENLKEVLGRLSMRGLEVEAIEDLSKGFENVVISQIKARDRHPNADRLSVCQVDNGKEVLQIVCGAQNMKAGDKVALSMVGANLPNGMKIEKGTIRGVESWGMLCSETELGLKDESEGILILPADAPVGEQLGRYLGKNDVVFELNITPNRGDALSHVGVARELAALLGQKISLPGQLAMKPNERQSFIPKSSDKFDVVLENPTDQELCWQYHGRYIEGVKIKPSPEWLQQRLVAVGLRPINNVVDVTNYVLMKWGQPLHAFDYARIKGSQIRVRLAKPGESLLLLDGTSVSLGPTDLVIADAERPIAMAGVMGGGNSEVSDATTSILLEAAQFAPSAVRKTSRHHQKQSDSSYRFERQIDAKSVVAAMESAVSLILETTGGKAYAGNVSKFSPMGQLKANGDPSHIKIKIVEVNRFLGTDLSTKQVQDCLMSVGFSSKTSSTRSNLEGGDELLVTVPSFRPDVMRCEDLYEEILRAWGYEKIEPQVPRLDFIPEPAGIADARERQIGKLKASLAGQGFSEVLNFAFTSKANNDRWGGVDSLLAVEIANPLNEELDTMKTSLLGGLIENLLAATRHQQRDLRLFEVRSVYKRDEKGALGVCEEWRVAAVFCGRSYSQALAARDAEIDFFDAKGFLESALESIGARGLRYQAMNASADSRFHPAQTADIALGQGFCGRIGRLHPKIEMELKSRQPVYMFEFSLDRALSVSKSDKKYSPISKFPKVERDLSLIVPRGMPAEKITQAVLKIGKPIVETVSVVDAYSGEKIPQGTMSLSIQMTWGDPARTLAEAEIDAMLQKLIAALDKDLGVKLRLQ